MVRRMNFEETLQVKTRQVDTVIRQYLPGEEGYQKTVLEAMNYSVLAGGKRLRPMLMQESFRLFGGSGSLVEPFMAAIEMIHTYSLVHDDLPAMDNDEYRRGRKTTWAVYGDGMAVLAGDGLLNLAFETAVRAFVCARDPEDYEKIARALQILSVKSGVYGMIGGQTADMEAEEGKTPLTEERLLFIHEKKTAALIQAALMVGAALAGAGEEALSVLEKAALNIGLAFQIRDDILDVTGTTETLGKPAGSDEKNHKLTYVKLKGLEAAREEVVRLSREASALLTSLEKENGFLLELVDFLTVREK